MSGLHFRLPALLAASALTAALLGACQPSEANSSTAETATIAQAAPVRVNEPAPNFTGVDSNGTSHTLSDFRGQVVVLEWTSHECPFTRKHYTSGNMQSLQADATDRDVVWLSVVSSAHGQQGYVEGDEANQLTRDRDANPTAVLLDPEGNIGQLYSARTTPHMFVIDAEGIIRYMGAIDSVPSANPADIPGATNFVSDALDSVLSDRPVETAFTQPYGCSVKYSL
ncbi:MAG: redoxin domain-containing protein [Cyanobacteria bacterium J06639_1]